MKVGYLLYAPPRPLVSDLPPAGAGSPTLESDFRDLRDERGLSLDDIHQETRVPVDVLRRFESGDLLADASFSDVYLRAFVKGYAKALGIPQARANAAFDAHRAGRYHGQLHEDYTPPEPPVLQTPVVIDDGAEEEATPPRETARTTAPAVEALRTGGTAVPAEQTAPRVEAQRVVRPVVTTARRSFDKNWGTIGALAFVLIALVAVALWFLVFREPSPDEPEVETASTETASSADSAATALASAGPRLQTPITVTAIADGGLQWFRVTSDSEERTPHWIDEGTNQTFSADSALVFWGEGNAGDTAYDFAETTLELQGLRWKPASGQAVRISLQNGQALLDSLARAGVTPSATPLQPAE